MLMAMKHVAERGYARATLKDIAADAGISSGTVFYYFPSKADLVASAYTEIVEPVIPVLRAAASREGPFVDAITALLETIIALVKSNPYLASFVAAIGVAGEDDPDLRKIFDRAIAVQHQLVADVVEFGRERGQLRTDIEPLAIADALFAMIRGLSDLSATVSTERHRAATECTALLIQGKLLSS